MSGVLAIIPARAGSKGIPGKNWKKIGGRPLLLWVAAAAKTSTRITRLLLSTDSELMRKMGEDAGLYCPKLRPMYLATDDAKTVDVIRYHVEQEIEPPSIVVILQPTCPLTQSRHINQAIDLLLNDPSLETVITVCQVDHYHPRFLYRKKAGGFEKLLPNDEVSSRHQLDAFYCHTGHVYAFRAHMLYERDHILDGRMGFVEVEKRFNVNIDDTCDWIMAEALIAAYRDAEA